MTEVPQWFIDILDDFENDDYSYLDAWESLTKEVPGHKFIEERVDIGASGYMTALVIWLEHFV